MFKPLVKNVSFPKQEMQTLEFWKEKEIYEKSLAQRSDAPKFVFFEGPPTANGLPHPGHCLTRAIKDLFPRYKTMRGFQCERKAGWDTHGLPVEVEVCKEIGIHSKEEIEAYGVEPFIHLCQESVWRYMQEWEKLTERLAFWLHLDKAYVTYHQSYVESVWWSLKNFFDRDLLYQGHKIVWWWAQGGTALSSGEVGEGYREVADPSVYVKFPLIDEPDTSLLIWTTTPWTLPSNQFAVVGPEIDYVLVSDEGSDSKLIIAKDLLEPISAKVKREFVVEREFKGSELLGKRYRPPFDYYYGELGEKVGKLKAGGEKHIAWRVLCDDFVTTDSGTGVVHQAPAFGEIDYEVLMKDLEAFEPGEGPELICAIGPDGKFTAEVPDFQGQWVKDADKPIVKALKEKGALFLLDQYLHDYPFCWRADQDPLIQYPRKSWFVRTTQFKDRMLENNSKINWLPEHIKTGRFGKFLESNVDWALSRERYWGTPLPIWVCSETGKKEAIGSYDELVSKPGATGMEVWEKAKAAKPDLAEDLKVHKPYIDEITYDSPFEAGGKMTRVTEVIDCWYDSGAMPFAQWGYPHQNVDKFKEQFPADFISEALDQTRGWFYSQTAISTLLFDKENTLTDTVEYPHPFANCIVLGLMMSESLYCAKCDKRNLEPDLPSCPDCGGKVVKRIEKMSKRLRNYREPNEIFDKYGADALRWFFFAQQAPWTNIIYSERTIKESIPEFLLRLWNVYDFFVIYANIDKFEPGLNFEGNAGSLGAETFVGQPGYRPVEQRSELDRWVISEMHRMLAVVIEKMDAYENYPACVEINSFVDSLSNWYVRRSRTVFWAKENDATKSDAYWTLYECLVTTAKVIAPFVPFVSETIWENLSSVFGESANESVHLCDFPEPDSKLIDNELSQRMSLLREIGSLARSARMEAKLKVRQPLAGVKVILNDATHQDWLQSHDSILKVELNVKAIEFVSDPETYIEYQIQPNFKRLGPRVGKLMPKVKAALGNADGGELLAEMNANGKIVIEVEGESIELDSDDIQIRLSARENWVAAQGKNAVVVLATDLTDELIREGYIRDLVRLVQDRRKELDLEFTDHIVIGVETESDDLTLAINEHTDYLTAETIADEVTFGSVDGAEFAEKQIGEFDLKIYVRKNG